MAGLAAAAVAASDRDEVGEVRFNEEEEEEEKEPDLGEGLAEGATEGAAKCPLTDPVKSP